MPISLRTALGLAFLLAACATPVRQAEQKAPPALPRDVALHPLGFTQIVFDIRRGTPLGSSRFSMFCGTHYPISWGSGRLTSRDVEFKDVFFHEMKAAGFDVVGDPADMFPDAERRRASFMVGARVAEVQLDLCDEVNILGLPTGGRSGSAYVKVAWQVYDAVERSVVLSAATEGTFHNTQGTPDGELVALLGALSAATANFAADARLYELVRADSAGRTAIAARQPAHDGPAIELPRLAPFKGPAARHMDAIRPAVVTVLVEGGHGSGFFVSPEGHILTNHHVVGDAKLVKLRLFSGREVLAEVVRSHKQRDIALLQAELRDWPALPLRLRPVEIGEDVLAIGTPLLKKLATTVTRGIASAMRREERSGLELIQSDVDIHAGNSGGPLLDADGNVVGVSVAGYAKDDTSVGLNLFIPIADALEKLNLHLAEKVAGRQ